MESSLKAPEIRPAGMAVLRTEFSDAPGVASVKFRVKAFLKANPEADSYVKKLSGDAGKDLAGRCLHYFFGWLAEQPGWGPAKGIVKRALDRQHRANNARDRRQLMLFEELLSEFLVSEIHGSRNYKLKFWISVHGMFTRNHVDLPGDASEVKGDGDSPPVKGNLSLDEVRRIVDACTLRDRAIFALMFQGWGMDRPRFSEFNTQHGWRQLKPQLDKNKEWISVHFPNGRKTNTKEYYVLYHRDWDAITFLKKFLATRGEPRRVGTSTRGEPVYEPIFLSRDKTPISENDLTQAWTMACARAGVIQRIKPQCLTCEVPMENRRIGFRNGRRVRVYVCPRCGFQDEPSKYKKQFARVRYGKNRHEIRDTLITILPKMAGVNEDLVEFIAGHDIDPLQYNKILNMPDWWGENELMKAEPFLNLWTHTGNIMERTEEVKELKEQLNEQILANARNEKRITLLEKLALTKENVEKVD